MLPHIYLILSCMQRTEEPIVQIDRMKPVRSPAQKRQLRIALIVLVLVIIVGGGAYFLLVPREEVYALRDYETAVVRRITLEDSAQAGGTVEVPVQVQIPNRQSGYSLELFAREGDQVNPDTLLGRLEFPEVEDSLFDKEVERTSAESSLAQIRTSHKYSRSRLLRDIEEAEDTVEKLNSLAQVNSARKSDLQDAEKILEELKFDLEEADELHVLAVQNAETTITQYQAQIGRLEEDLSAAFIRSPIEGEVTYINPLLAIPGTVLQQGVHLFTVVDRTSAVVVLNFNERYAGQLAVGMSINLTVNNRTYSGTITKVGSVAEASSAGLSSTIPVTADPETGEDLLLPGASAIGEVLLGDRENVLTFKRGPYLTTGSEKYLYRVEGKRAEKVTGTFGAIQSNTVEILAGVYEGDEIIISGYQNFIEYDNVELKE
jgi:HlyD family secretion protein